VKYFIWVFATLLIFVLQGGISVLGTTLNLTVILACYAGVRRRSSGGILLGALLGAIQDNLTGTILGPHMLSKGLIAYFSSGVYSRFFIWTPLLGVVSLFLLTVADGIMILSLRALSGDMPVTYSGAVLVIGLQALFNAPFGVLMKPHSEVTVLGRVR
jgi:rod shape-determining protein MreD